MTSNVVIIGSALSGNKGAAAMLESAVQTLTERIPDIRFTLLSMYPDEDHAQNPYENLEIIDARPLVLGVGINSLALGYRLLPPLRKLMRSRSRAVQALADADVLLDQGGITFVDGREKFLLYNIASILPAINMGVPVVKCAQALGTFEGKMNRWAARRFLPKMYTIVSRGAITHDYLDELGLSNAVAGADYAFLLDLTDEERQGAEEKFDVSFFADGDVVGISPSVVMQKKIDADGGDYAGEIIRFIDYVTGERGMKVALIPHSARVNTGKTHNNDLPLCRAINERLVNRKRVLFIDQELSSQELRHAIGLTSVFVASRFHAMVSSLSMAVPTLVIGWSHKYQEVLDMFGLAEWAFGKDKFNQAYLRDRFRDLVDRREEIAGQLGDALPKVRLLAQVQVDEIERILHQAR
ncbi:MAG: polysaccharide pyruvyl transferase family protein [Agrococcus casei]|uniref:polysaccharide pyruvyl transferase family protein n=1 Tax=Agrococcus casei TaxID=343512 RepID=UPI003F8E4BB7